MEKFNMKYEICDEYKKRILLSEFNLEEHNFTNGWLDGFFSNPIVDKIAIVNQNNQIVETDLYINFAQVELPNNLSTSQLFKQLNNYIKKHIFIDWGIMNTIYPIYNFYGINSDDKNYKKFLFIFLSPNKSNQVFNFDIISNKDTLIQNILEMLLKSTIIEKINQQNPIAADICSGKVFLNPVVTNNEKTGKNYVNVFSYRLIFQNFKLGVSLKNEHFILESDKSKIQLYDDVCFINKFKYEKKEDARTYGRLFLDFRSFDKLKKTKFITQLELHKLMQSMLDKFNIKYQKTVFEPQYLYNHFSSYENKLTKINVYISEYEKEKFEKDLTEKGVNHGLNGLLDYLKNQFNITSKLFLNPKLKDLLINNNEYNLFLMYGEKYKEDYVSLKIEGKEAKLWNDCIIPFLQEEMYKLNQHDFFETIKYFDTYSQVKLFNLYANISGLSPIVSQGFILDKSVIFEKPVKSIVEDKENIELFIESENEVSVHPPKKIGKEKLYPLNGTKSVIGKIINELNIKYDLFVNKSFFFNVQFSDIKNDVSFNNIKIIQMLPKEKNRLYSVLNLKKTLLKNENKANFEVVSHQVLINKQVNSLNLEIDIDKEFKSTSHLIIIDDTYLIKVKDNNLMPFLIIEEKNLNNAHKDPSLLIEQHIIKGTSLSTSVSKTSEVNNNLFYPYNTPVTNKLINKNIRHKQSYTNCLLDFSDEELKVFITLSDSSINATMSKNNRLENIQLLKINNFCFEKERWKGNEQILYFYLSSLTFNYISINELAKKSLLNKLTEVILVN